MLPLESLKGDMAVGCGTYFLNEMMYLTERSR